MDGQIIDIAKQFQINFDECFFPKNLLDFSNFNYVGKIPNFEAFISEFDCNLTKQKKQKFVNLYTNLKWNFRKELLIYIQQKLLLLALATLKFFEEFLSLEEALKVEKHFCPFQKPIFTIGSAIYKLFKLIYLPKYPLYTVMNEYKSKGLSTSRGEHQFLSYIENKFYKDSNDFLAAFNNPFGQKYFKEAVPDGYSISKKICYFYNGCYRHFCIEHNLIGNLDKCFAENELFNKKMEKLMQNNPDEIEAIEIIWECKMDQFKKNHPDYDTFLKNDYVKRPLENLVPRNTYKGGYHDTYYCRWSKSNFPEEDLFFFDVNGLYSSVAIKNKFMIGKYKILVGKDLKKLHVKNCKFFYDNVPVMGSIFLSIVPPSNLLYPFLMYKAKNGQMYNPLCSQCCDKNLKKCSHSNCERALIGTYMLSEIEYALELKYTILDIFECHIYVESDFLLKDFVKHLVFRKTISSNCFENLTTLTQKEKYCDELNTQMDFDNPLKITVTNVKPNPPMRYFYKIAQNSFFGKFGQRNDGFKTAYCTSQLEIENILSENRLIKDAYTVGENLCCLVYQPDKVKLKPSLKHSVYLSSQITAFAREEIHKHLLSLINAGIKVVKVNCDSIIFAVKKGQTIPLPISHAVGHFKSEINGTILDFFAVGSKNYIIIYLDCNGKKCYMNKISGLSLESRSFNDEEYTKFLYQLHLDLVSFIKVPNKKRKVDWKNLNVKLLCENFTISNTFPLRRILLHINECTVPFGFN